MTNPDPPAWYRSEEEAERALLEEESREWQALLTCLGVVLLAGAGLLALRWLVRWLG